MSSREQQVGGRFGHEGPERDTHPLWPHREQGVLDGEKVGVVAGVPSFGDAHDAGEQGRVEAVEEPPAALPSGDDAAIGWKAGGTGWAAVPGR
jgi:hypothetical protein